MIEEAKDLKDNTIINLYAPNKLGLKYTKQSLVLLRLEMQNSMIIVGDSKTHQSIIDRTKRHTHTKITISEDLNDMINETSKIGAINKYRILQSTEYAFFFKQHGTLPKFNRCRAIKHFSTNFKRQTCTDYVLRPQCN